MPIHSNKWGLQRLNWVQLALLFVADVHTFLTTSWRWCTSHLKQTLRIYPLCGSKLKPDFTQYVETSDGELSNTLKQMTLRVVVAEINRRYVSELTRCTLSARRRSMALESVIFAARNRHPVVVCGFVLRMGFRSFFLPRNNRKSSICTPTF